MRPAFSLVRCCRPILGLVVAAWSIEPAQGIVLLDSDDALQNATAPTGAYQDSGWQHLGLFGGFLGTAISPHHFITAQHMGVVSGTFVQSAEFTGGSEVVHTIDASANGGLGYWDIVGTDLRIFAVDGAGFSGFASLYTGNTEVGEEWVVFGRGGPRGDAVMESGQLKGWKHTGGDGVTRWGINTVTGIVNQAGSQLLQAEFNNLPGQNEATLSVGDSGGPVFILDGGEWRLAGVNFGVDGAFDTNNVTGDGSEFGGALFDRGGLWQGSDASSWQLITDTPADDPSSMYASRISASVSEIQAITLVPEPGSLTLVLAAVILVRRRVRQR